MDDYDGSGDSKENQVKNNFCYLAVVWWTAGSMY